ncbi:DUF6873 family GME fold protein [Clostridium paraputrificum]|uniref:DUF6873 family GME fold protein n=1 Tax=Clostridium TaxID=1485 RepID=UPI003D332B8E
MHCFVDYRTTTEELNNLIKLNLEPIIIPKTSSVYKAIDGHVDIQLNIVDYKKRIVIIQKNIDKNFIDQLVAKNINYIFSKEPLGNNYPNDIILNGLVLDNHFIHNINYTDENFLETQKDKTIIHVNQGYTKCSVLPIRNNALITNDSGIYDSLYNSTFDVLLLPPGDILLPSLNYGFIGGTGGMISNNKLGLFGELQHYIHGEAIYDFLYKYDVEPISLKKGKLIDRGSLFCI